MNFQKENGALDSYKCDDMPVNTKEGTRNHDDLETCNLCKTCTNNNTKNKNDQTMDGYGMVGELVI